MTLQEFVRDSLLQISDGVDEAKKKNKNIGLEVTALGKQEASCTTADRRAGFLFDFDVAVTVSEKLAMKWVEEFWSQACLMLAVKNQPTLNSLQ